ncbi:MAG TPA: response regulator transcription factor [Candidatus Ratteibacteria bacterium]|nr:response regulator transcription factor [Candidatus Ratteibacteria bacterium]
MNERIAIVEDEIDILNLMKKYLEKNNFLPFPYTNANDFLKNIEKEKFDLVLLDLMLPDMDGIDVCKNIKTNPKTEKIPVIMLTARTDEGDKILGLEIGADDYITKPFSLKELLARIRAVLRRYKLELSTEKIYIGKEIIIDPKTFEVLVNNKRINLTYVEFKILLILASKKSWVFSRDKIIELLWEGEKFTIEKAIDVHINNLRAKLGKYGKYIKTIRGVGYKIEE